MSESILACGKQRDGTSSMLFSPQNKQLIRVIKNTDNIDVNSHSDNLDCQVEEDIREQMKIENS